VDREPCAKPVTKLEFEFERRRVTKEDIRELIYREILEYHPKMLREFLEAGTESSGFMYPRFVSLSLFFWTLQLDVQVYESIIIFSRILLSCDFDCG
jgi:hypothetical protein